MWRAQRADGSVGKQPPAQTAGPGQAVQAGKVQEGITDGDECQEWAHHGRLSADGQVFLF